MVRYGIGLSVVLLSLPLMAESFVNESYLCSHPQVTQKRVIEVNYLQATSAVPCDVKYSKGEETKVLWQAQTEQGYCEAKAKEFLEKQAAWGWQCEKMQQL